MPYAVQTMQEPAPGLPLSDRSAKHTIAHVPVDPSRSLGVPHSLTGTSAHPSGAGDDSAPCQQADAGTLEHPTGDCNMTDGAASMGPGLSSAKAQR